MNTRTTTALAGLAIAAGMLTGCGHDQPTQVTPAAHTSPAHSLGPGAAPRDFATPAALADVLGCSSTLERIDAAIYAESQGQCQFAEGVSMTLTTYATNDTRDNYLDAAAGFGGIYVYGDRWSINSDVIDRDQGQQLADVIGHGAKVR